MMNKYWKAEISAGYNTLISWELVDLNSYIVVKASVQYSRMYDKGMHSVANTKKVGDQG